MSGFAYTDMKDIGLQGSVSEAMRLVFCLSCTLGYHCFLWYIVIAGTESHRIQSYATLCMRTCYYCQRIHRVL